MIRVVAADVRRRSAGIRTILTLKNKARPAIFRPLMIHSAITISLVPEARGGPFVFWDDLAAGCAHAAALGFDAVEIFPRSTEDLNAKQVRQILKQHKLKLAAMGTGAGWVVHKLRLTDSDAKVRTQARAFIASVIDFAGGFGALPFYLFAKYFFWHCSGTHQSFDININ